MYLWSLRTVWFSQSLHLTACNLTRVWATWWASGRHSLGGATPRFYLPWLIHEVLCSWRFLRTILTRHTLPRITSSCSRCRVEAAAAVLSLWLLHSSFRVPDWRSCVQRYRCSGMEQSAANRDPVVSITRIVSAAAQDPIFSSNVMLSVPVNDPEVLRL